MVEIEAAQKILVRLSATRMLRDDDARHGFEDLPATQDWPVGQLRRAGGALGCRIGNANQAVLPAFNDDFRQPGNIGGGGCWGSIGCSDCRCVGSGAKKSDQHY